MKIKSQKDFVSGIALIAVGGAFAIGATNYSFGTSIRPGPGYFPFGLGIIQAFLEYWTDASAAKVIVLLLVVLLLQFRPQGLVAVQTRSLA